MDSLISGVKSELTCLGEAIIKYRVGELWTEYWFPDLMRSQVNMGAVNTHCSSLNRFPLVLVAAPFFIHF